MDVGPRADRPGAVGPAALKRDGIVIASFRAAGEARLVGGSSRSFVMKKRYVPVVGPRLKKLLFVVLGLFALLAVNSAYMVSVTALEAATGRTYQNWFYLVMFLLHLVLGAAIVVPVLVFGVDPPVERDQPAQPPGRGRGSRPVRHHAGAAGDRHPADAHRRRDHDQGPGGAARPLLGARHRAAGGGLALRAAPSRRPPHQVEGGAALGGGGGGVRAGCCSSSRLRTRGSWNVEGPKSGEQYFFPSLARTATGNFIPSKVLADDRVLPGMPPRRARRLVVERAPLQLVQQPALPASACARRARSRMERDGNVQAARWCAGCHDPVPFFSGAFDDPKFDDVRTTPTAQAGITCTVCHAITHVNSTRGNADYTIEEPIHYPFAFSENAMLQLGQQPAGQGQAGVPQEDVPQAAPQDGRVLLDLPQGAPAGGAEPLQVPARPEPLRHVPAPRRLGPRRAELLLPAEGEGELHRLPHAAARVRATSAPRTSTAPASSGSTTTCSRRRTPASRRCVGRPDGGRGAPASSTRA